jgi:hypothetical protein
MPALQRIPLSHSRLTKAKCLYLFNAMYVAKTAKEPKSTPMLVGGFFHDMAERWTLHLQNPGDVPTDLDSYRAMFDYQWRDRGSREYAALGDEEYDELIRFSEAWAEHFSIDENLVGAEVRLAFNERWEKVDYFAPDVFFRAIMDRLEAANGIAYVTDYKTSWKADSQEDAERNPQMKGYAMAVDAIVPDLSEIVVTLEFVRIGVKRTVVISKQQIEEARDRIMTESNRIEKARAKKNWPATPGAVCEFCPVFDRCPAKSAAAQFHTPTNQEDAASLMGNYALLKKNLKLVEGMLQAWVKNYGPVRGGGLVADYDVTETRHYPHEQLIAVLNGLGLDSAEYFKPDNERLKKDAAKQSKKGDERMTIALGNLVVMGHGSKWSVKKEAQDG